MRRTRSRMPLRSRGRSILRCELRSPLGRGRRATAERLGYRLRSVGFHPGLQRDQRSTRAEGAVACAAGCAGGRLSTGSARQPACCSFRRWPLATPICRSVLPASQRTMPSLSTAQFVQFVPPEGRGRGGVACSATAVESGKPRRAEDWRVRPRSTRSGTVGVLVST